MALIDKIKTIATKQDPVYLITGKNDYWENEVMQQIKRIIPEEEQTMNFATYDMEETPLSVAINDALSVPFFGEKRLVLIKNAYFLTGSKSKSKVKYNVDELEQYLDNPSSETVLIILAPYDKLDGRKKIVKKLKNKSTTITLNDFSERETADFVRKQVHDRGYEMSPDAMNELYARTLGDLGKMMNELQKIFIYCNDSKNIDVDVVDKLVSKSLDQNVFALVNYVVNGQTTQAIQFYSQLLEQKQEPIQINAILESQFRLLLQVKILIQHSYSQSMMTNTLKIHPYRIKLAMQSAQRFPLNYLRDAYLQLVQIECKLKSSTDNPELLFEMFAIKLGQKKNSI
ncbi:DNA polymerase III subunit delta [Fructilactobacillus sp. Tb1]|uniref:DNA polymerase III subunit delta n=1 Tax=Fructilactobacillus sp. Tb1 TaxID=3422304 RepID=UPI003D2D782C